MKKALLIGINKYQGHNELHCCVNDIHELKGLLERNEDGTKNLDVHMLEDVQSPQEALDSIRTLFDGDGDTSLFYFSGHGSVNELGADLVFPDSITGTGSASNGIKMSDLLQIVNKSKVKNKVVILDCCYSGNMGKLSDDSSLSVLSTGVSILTACKENESALEVKDHGVFTNILCSALEGGAADFSGNITIGGIYAYIDRSFGAWEQRPIFKTNVSAFAPLRHVNAKVPLSIIIEITKLFISEHDCLDLDPSFEDSNTPECEHLVVEPYANGENVRKFKILQKLQSIGFVEPVDAEFMYYAAMKSKQCKLTRLGQYYWNLVKNNQI